MDPANISTSNPDKRLKELANFLDDDDRTIYISHVNIPDNPEHVGTVPINNREFNLLSDNYVREIGTWHNASYNDDDNKGPDVVLDLTMAISKNGPQPTYLVQLFHNGYDKGPGWEYTKEQFNNFMDVFRYQRMETIAGDIPPYIDEFGANVKG